MRKWIRGIVLFVMVMSLPVGHAVAKDPSAFARDRIARQADPARVDATSSGPQRSIATAIWLTPGPSGFLYSLDARVVVPAKQGRGARCKAFVVDATAAVDRVTLGTFCRPGPGERRVKATLVVVAQMRDEMTYEPVQLIDRCELDRSLKRKGTGLTCTVEFPTSGADKRS